MPLWRKPLWITLFGLLTLYSVLPPLHAYWLEQRLTQLDATLARQYPFLQLELNSHQRGWLTSYYIFSLNNTLDDRYNLQNIKLLINHGLWFQDVLIRFDNSIDNLMGRLWLDPLQQGFAFDLSSEQLNVPLQQARLLSKQLKIKGIVNQQLAWRSDVTQLQLELAQQAILQAAQGHFEFSKGTWQLELNDWSYLANNLNAKQLNVQGIYQQQSNRLQQQVKLNAKQLMLEQQHPRNIITLDNLQVAFDIAWQPSKHAFVSHWLSWLQQFEQNAQVNMHQFEVKSAYGDASFNGQLHLAPANGQPSAERLQAQLSGQINVALAERFLNEDWLNRTEWLYRQGYLPLQHQHWLIELSLDQQGLRLNQHPLG